MKITFLGTGTSQGVPVVGCNCHVCSSLNPKDKRLRSSIHVQLNETSIIIDTGTDFRQQLLANKIDDIDAIVYTHEHKDHIAGLDDIRPINFLQNKSIAIYAEERVQEALKREFHYAFSAIDYPGIPKLLLNTIVNQPFTVDEITLIPIRVMHHKLPIFGFRISNFAYITDANFIEQKELDKLKNLDVLVINALRYQKHISHFTMQEAMEIASLVQAKRTYFTHISHLLDCHHKVCQELPANMSLAFDGLQLHL